MRTRIKLLVVNVALAALAAFLGGLATAEALCAAEGWDCGRYAMLTTAVLSAAGYGALRAAVGLGQVYADKLSRELQAEVDWPETGH